MHARGPSQWQSRRKMSLGPPVRRAHPASGATWNVQVVRGKMTSRCLWHACRALMLGMVLMMLGAGMATIGYYAEDLSFGQEIRGNATVRVKNESRGFHLNNLSYVGPIVMGFGGFIVVAACVMTFEARDSAAKVVPARFKLSTTSRTNPRTNSSSRRTTASAISTSQAGSQTNRWDNHLGVFRTSPAEGVVPDRKALTAALVHFSRALGSPRRTGNHPTESNSSSPGECRRVSRSGSVPNLTTIPPNQRTFSTQSTITISPTILYKSSHHNSSSSRTARHVSRHSNSLVHHRSGSKAIGSSSSPYLTPVSRLQFRQALSVDDSGPQYYGHRTKDIESVLHAILANENGGSSGAGGGICSGSGSRIRDRTKRSDTARRHVLSRQKPIEKEEPHSPRNGTARKTTAMDITNAFRKGKGIRSASQIIRTPSNDSRGVQTEVISSPDLRRQSGKHSPKKRIINQLSTPSVERDYKSQISISSEPGNVRCLSGQSSLEPSLPEESPEQEDIAPSLSVAIDKTNMKIRKSPKRSLKIDEQQSKSTEHPFAVPLKRPDTLILNCNQHILNTASSNENITTTSKIIDNSNKSEKQKYLYRSNSSRMYKRPNNNYNINNNNNTNNNNNNNNNSSNNNNNITNKSKMNLENEIDKIYFISSNKNPNNVEEYYDSTINVIDERRMKNFKKSGSTSGFYRSSTVIYSEYCSGIDLVNSGEGSGGKIDLTISNDSTNPNKCQSINNESHHNELNEITLATPSSTSSLVTATTRTTTTATTITTASIEQWKNADEIIIESSQMIGCNTENMEKINQEINTITATEVETKIAIIVPTTTPSDLFIPCQSKNIHKENENESKSPMNYSISTTPPIINNIYREQSTIIVQADIEDCGKD